MLGKSSDISVSHSSSFNDKLLKVEKSNQGSALLRVGKQRSFSLYPRFAGMKGSVRKIPVSMKEKHIEKATVDTNLDGDECFASEQFLLNDYKENTSRHRNHITTHLDVSSDDGDDDEDDDFPMRDQSLTLLNTSKCVDELDFRRAAIDKRRRLKEKEEEEGELSSSGGDFSHSDDGEKMEDGVDMFSLSSDSDDLEIRNKVDLIEQNDSSICWNDNVDFASPFQDASAKTCTDVRRENPPRMIRKSQSHKPAMNQLLHKRNFSEGDDDAKRRLVLVEEDGMELSDFDSYADEDPSDLFNLSSDSDEENGEIDSEKRMPENEEIVNFDDNIKENDAGNVGLREAVLSAVHRAAAKERNVADLFTQPKQYTSLFQRIRRNRIGIQALGMKRRAQGIEESFVLSTGARRSSDQANQARARAKLQKRIELRKAANALTDEGQREVVNKNLLSGFDSMKRKNKIQPSLSFEAFEEKKAMVTNYSAYQSLREHYLETQRLH